MSDGADLERIDRLIDLRRWPEVDAALASALAREPEDAALLLLSARRHLALGDPRHALEAARAAVAVAPYDPDGYRFAALALSELRQRRDATAAARTALDLDPHDPYNHAVLAVTGGRWRHRGQSRRAATEAVRLAPDDAEIHLIRSVVALRSWRPREARAAARRALELDPENADARQMVALTQVLRPDRMLNGLWSALSMDPLNASARRNLSAALQQTMWLTWLIGAIGLGSAALLTAGREPRAATTGSVLLGVALIVLLGLLAAGLWAALDDGPRHGLARVVRDDSAVILLLALALMVAVGALAMCFVPRTAVDLIVAVSPVYRIGVVATWLLWWGQRRRPG